MATALARIADLLTQVEWGRQAEQFTTASAVYPRPIWVMRAPQVSLGRKAADRVPLRVEYPDQTDVATTTAPTGKINSLGVRESLTEIRTSPEEPTALIDAAKAARWAMIDQLAGSARTYVRRHHSALAISSRTESLLSRQSLDEIADKICLVDIPDTLLVRVNQPGTCRRVDPQRWLTVACATRARELVRQAVGDPREGDRIRQRARALATSDVDLLVDHFAAQARRSGQERSRVTRSAVQAALQLAHHRDPMIGWVSMSEVVL